MVDVVGFEPTSLPLGRDLQSPVTPPIVTAHPKLVRTVGFEPTCSQFQTEAIT